MKTFSLLLTLALVVAACSPQDEGSDAPLVVATTTMLGDLASNVVGEEGTVETLMPVGADPHGYSPSSSDAALLASADLVVANGLGLEEGLADVLESVAGDGVPVLFVAPELDPLPFSTSVHHEDEADHEEEADHEHDLDPHVWMDPIRMADAARLLGRELEELFPDSDDIWDRQAEEYAEELEATDVEIDSILETIPARKLVTNHGSLGYFAHRYDFEVIGVVVPGGSTLSEPSSAELAELVQIMIDEAATAIFAETTESSDLAEAVAAEIGEEVQVIELYTGSLGEPGSGAETLIGMLTTNAELIAGALTR